MAINYASFRNFAISQGRSPQEVDAFIEEKKKEEQQQQAITQSAKIQEATPQEQPQAEDEGGFVDRVIKGVADQALGGLRLGGEALFQAGRSIVDPAFRKNVDEMTPEEIERVAGAKAYQFISPEEGKVYENVEDLGDFTKASVEASKKFAGTAAFVPGVGAGPIAAGALSGFSNTEEDASLGETVTNVATGAATGWVFDKTVGKWLLKPKGQGGEGLKEAGSKVKRSVINPKVPASVGGAQREQAIAGVVDKYTSGSAANRYTQLQEAVKNIGGKVDDQLAKSDPEVPISTLEKSFDDKLSQIVNYRGGANPEFAGAKTALMDRLKNFLGVRTSESPIILPDNLASKAADQIGSKTAKTSQLLQFKSSLGDSLGKAFDKLHNPQAPALTPDEEFGLALWFSVDDVMPSAVKNLTVDQSYLIASAPGLASARNTIISTGKMASPLGTSIRIPTATAQKAVDLFGTGLQKAGSAVSNVGVKAPRFVNAEGIGATAATQAVQNITGGGDQAEAETLDTALPPPIIAANSQTQQIPGVPSATEFDQAAARAFQSGNNKAADEIFKQKKNFYPTSTGGKPSAQAVALATSGNQSLADVERLLTKDPDVLNKQLVPGQFFSREYDSAAFNAMDNLLRLRTGAQAPPDEVRSYVNKLMPRFGDSKEVVDFKIKQLRRDFGNYMNGTYQAAPTVLDTITAQAAQQAAQQISF